MLIDILGFENAIDLLSDPIVASDSRKRRKVLGLCDKLVILEHWKRGTKTPQIAQQLGLDKSTVYKIIKDAPRVLRMDYLELYPTDMDEFRVLFPESVALGDVPSHLEAKQDPKRSLQDIEDEGKRRKKRVALSIADKFNIIRLSRCDVPVRKIMTKYNVAESTIQKIIRSQDDIISSCESARLSGRIEATTRKHRKNGPYVQLNDLCFKWFSQKQLHNPPGVLIPRKVVKAKALEIAQKLAVEDRMYDKFKGSDGWLDSFFRSYGIVKASSATATTSNSAVAVSQEVPGNPLEHAKEMVRRVMEIAREHGILFEERAMGLAQLEAEFDELLQKETDETFHVL